MPEKKMRVALVGAASLLGKELLSELSDSPAAAAWQLRLLEGGSEAEGQLTASADEALVLHSLAEDSFTAQDLVFFAGDTALTREYLPAALAAGAAVVDLTGATEAESGFVLRSPWLAGGRRADLTTVGVCAPHPVTLLLLLLLERVQGRFSAPHLTATVLQPASEAGAAGVDELHQQTVSLLSFHDVPKEVFDSQVAFNVQPRLGAEARLPLSALQDRIVAEMRSLTGSPAELPVSFQLLQAPVFHAHVLSVHLQLAAGATVSEEEVRRALASGLLVADPEQVPSNQAATESGEVLVSVEADPLRAGAFWITVAADNLRLAARNAVQSAVELLSLRTTTHVQ